MSNAQVATVSTNGEPHNDEPLPPNATDPCAKRIREEADYNRSVRCKNCKLIFCIIASVAVAAGIILIISGAVALWPTSEESDENLPLILTIPQQCCQDNDDNDDDNDDQRDKHKHKDKHHNHDDDD